MHLLHFRRISLLLSHWANPHIMFKDPYIFITTKNILRAGGEYMGIRNNSKTKKYKSIPYNGDRNVDQADCMKRLWGKVHNIQIQIWNENVIFHRFILVLSYLRLTINIFFFVSSLGGNKNKMELPVRGKETSGCTSPAFFHYYNSNYPLIAFHSSKTRRWQTSLVIF